MLKFPPPNTNENRIEGLTRSAKEVPKALTSEGVSLDTIKIDPGDADIIRTIDLAGDSPSATYVTRRTVSGLRQQRTPLGEWIPWDGNVEMLKDNGFPEAGGKMVFDIFHGDLSNEFFPVNFSVAYRTEAGLRFGVFQVIPHASAFD